MYGHLYIFIRVSLYKDTLYKSILTLGIYYSWSQHFFNLQLTFLDRGESAHKAILYRCPLPRSDFVQPNGVLTADEGERGDGEGWRKSGNGACYVMEHASVSQSVSQREACKTWCAHVTENQFNDYLEHATNTEHASLITLPRTNVHLRAACATRATHASGGSRAPRTRAPGAPRVPRAARATRHARHARHTR